MKTFAIVNRKGGVGKTTTAVNLAYVLATTFGKRVLLIDADSQGNASSICFHRNEGGLAAVLSGIEPYYENLIDQTDVKGLDLLPATEELDDFDLDRSREPDYYALRRWLDVLEEDDAYDVCVIDCPPYYSVSCLNGIAASDRVVIPADTTAYSAEGIESLVRQINNVRRAVPGLSVSGVLITGVRRSDVDEDAVALMRGNEWIGINPFDAENIAQFREKSVVHVFETVIRRSDDKVRESSWARMATCQWSPWCNASRDYRAWVTELCEREGL